MATRKNFEAGLDKEPGDLVLRQVYADWLEELGFDDEAYAQRWMAQERKRPVPAAPRYFRGQWQWEWYGTRRYPGRPRSKHHAVLPQEVSRLLSYDSAVCGTDDGSAETFGFRGYQTRQEAEADLVMALRRLRRDQKENNETCTTA